MQHVNGETGEVTERRALGMPPAIAAAIVAVKKQVRQLGVDEDNKFAGYKYVSVDKFYATVGPIMAEAGLALIIDETSSAIEISESTERDGKVKKTPWLFVQYSLSFLHESGAVSAPMRRSLAMPINGPQTYGAAQSYIEKQFLRQVFKIPTGDKDADETAQGDDAPARGRAVPRRQEAAPAPSEAAAEARQQVRELMDAIDATEDPAALSAFAGWPQLTAVEQALKAAAIPDGDRRETMSMLAGRARKRREQLPGNLEAFNG
jgi:hypothetical protein